MGDVVLLPGVTEVLELDAVEPVDLAALLEHQNNLLLRWKDFGEELKRRAEYPLPFDLALELHDLLLIEEYL